MSSRDVAGSSSHAPPPSTATSGGSASTASYVFRLVREVDRRRRVSISVPTVRDCRNACLGMAFGVAAGVSAAAGFAALRDGASPFERAAGTAVLSTAFQSIAAFAVLTVGMAMAEEMLADYEYDDDDASSDGTSVVSRGFRSDDPDVASDAGQTPTSE